MDRIVADGDAFARTGHLLHPGFRGLTRTDRSHPDRSHPDQGRKCWLTTTPPATSTLFPDRDVIDQDVIDQFGLALENPGAAGGPSAQRRHRPPRCGP